jgi:hypothetical protein
MGWDGMGWDGMGWDGMGWEGGVGGGRGSWGSWKQAGRPAPRAVRSHAHPLQGPPRRRTPAPGRRGQAQRGGGQGRRQDGRARTRLRHLVDFAQVGRARGLVDGHARGGLGGGLDRLRVADQGLRSGRPAKFSSVPSSLPPDQPSSRGPHLGRGASGLRGPADRPPGHGSHCARGRGSEGRAALSARPTTGLPIRELRRPGAGRAPMAQSGLSQPSLATSFTSRGREASLRANTRLLHGLHHGGARGL